MTEPAIDPALGVPGPADMVEIFYAPSAVFARRRAGQWGLAYVVFAVIGIGLFFATKNLLQPAIDADISRGLAAAAAKMGTTPDKVPGAGMMRTIASASVVAYFLIAPFVVALLLWIAGKIARVPNIGTTALAIAVFSMFPKLIGMVAAGVESAILPDSAMTSAAAISFSPARFINPATSPGLSALMLRFDIFLLWGVVLSAIGVRVAGGGTRGQAWATAIGVWAIATLPAVWALIRS
jgi:hypothetical protein